MNQTDLSPLYCVRLEGPESRLDYILGYKPKRNRLPGKDKFLDDLASAFSRACQSCEHEGTRAADLIEHAIEILIKEKDYLLIHQSPLHEISRLRPASEQITITPANRIEAKIPYFLDLKFLKNKNGKEKLKSVITMGSTLVKPSTEKTLSPIYELTFGDYEELSIFLFTYEGKGKLPNEEKFKKDISEVVKEILLEKINLVEKGKEKFRSSRIIDYFDVMSAIVKGLGGRGYRLFYMNEDPDMRDLPPIRESAVQLNSRKITVFLNYYNSVVLEPESEILSEDEKDIYERIPQEIKERFKKAAEKKENWISPSLYEGYKRELEQQGKKHEF
ncbi:hypothetical protein DRJ19_02585 [Candidatus Woesearchaeota archaeon]|nr:MAG: hypothetical protein DRJ19_02585 [Candidatus Woesearchaeota archaeon]